MASVPVADEFVDHTTASALEEKAKLQRHFGRFDILFFLLCTLVGIDTIGAVVANGAEAFTWLILLGAFFFLPYGLLTSELGTAFPEEGGPYVWTKLAFGRFGAGSTPSSTGCPTRSGWAGSCSASGSDTSCPS